MESLFLCCLLGTAYKVYSLPSSSNEERISRLERLVEKQGFVIYSLKIEVKSQKAEIQDQHKQILSLKGVVNTQQTQIRDLLNNKERGKTFVQTTSDNGVSYNVSVPLLHSNFRLKTEKGGMEIPNQLVHTNRTRPLGDVNQNQTGFSKYYLQPICLFLTNFLFHILISSMISPWFL